METKRKSEDDLSPRRPKNLRRDHFSISNSYQGQNIDLTDLLPSSRGRNAAEEQHTRGPRDPTSGQRGVFPSQALEDVIQDFDVEDDEEAQAYLAQVR